MGAQRPGTRAPRRTSSRPRRPRDDSPLPDDHALTGVAVRLFARWDSLGLEGRLSMQLCGQGVFMASARKAAPSRHNKSIQLKTLKFQIGQSAMSPKINWVN